MKHIKQSEKEIRERYVVSLSIQIYQRAIRRRLFRNNTRYREKYGLFDNPILLVVVDDEKSQNDNENILGEERSM